MIIIINNTNTHLIFQSKPSVCPLSNIFLTPKPDDLGASLLLLIPLLVNLQQDVILLQMFFYFSSYMITANGRGHPSWAVNERLKHSWREP